MFTTIFTIRGIWWTFLYLCFSFSAGTTSFLFFVKSGFHFSGHGFCRDYGFYRIGDLSGLLPAPPPPPRLAARASN
jgi:hypothetical protein